MTTTTEPLSTQLHAYSNEIASLRRELAGADATTRAAIKERIATLRVRRDELRRQAVDATGREVARLESDRVMAEHAVTVARGSAGRQAEAKVGQIHDTMARYRAELTTHIAAITADADVEIAALKRQAAAPATPARQRLAALADRLQTMRDAVAAKGRALAQATAGEWTQAKSDFDASLRDLAAVDGGDHA
jgi:hypothetical protein